MLLADSSTLSPQALAQFTEFIPLDRRIFRLRGAGTGKTPYRARFLPNHTVEVFSFHPEDATLGQCITIPPIAETIFHRFYEPSGIEIPTLSAADPASTTPTIPPTPTPPTARRPRARKSG